jgi:hypothetical protein
MNVNILRSLFCGSLVLLLVVLPAAASPILVTDSFSPNPPLVPGGQQLAVSTFAIPSGTTFPKTHNLQLQTGLTDAQWTIQVILDGNDAARQTATGSAAFINGELLAYSVNHDVSFTVTINGKVPGSATGTVTVVDMVEIDNTGTIVPGSQIVVTQPVQGLIPVTITTGIPALTTPPATTPVPATKSPGFSGFIGIAGCCLAGLAWVRNRR